MFIGEWQAQLVKDPPGVYGAFLYLWRKSSNGDTEFLLKDGCVKAVPHGSSFPIGEDYSFALFEPEQLAAIAEAFSNSGVKTVSEHKIAGLLDAKDAHLQDMRALVFKGKQQV